MKKALAAVLLAASISGCATHATIQQPALAKVSKTEWNSKTLNYKILFSQPEPGLIGGGEQQPMTPLKDAKLSLGSEMALKDLPTHLEQQMPAGVKLVNDDSGDYGLEIRITAHSKRGPAYGDYQFLSSFAKNLLILGLGPKDYLLIADFDAEYALSSKGGDRFSKTFTVKDSVEHQRGPFESLFSPNEYAAQLLRKHMSVTLNDFLKQAADKVN
jgi:hypothetical protein